MSDGRVEQLIPVHEPTLGRDVFVTKDMMPLPDPIDSPLYKFAAWSGVRAFSNEDAEEVVCAICGQGAAGLGNHVWKKHGIHAAVYKEALGLNKRTGLLGITAKARYVLASRRNFRSLPRALVFRGPKHRRNNRYSPEERNRRHTCDNQVTARLHSLVRELDRMPTWPELQKAGIPYVHIKRLEEDGLFKATPDVGKSGRKVHSDRIARLVHSGLCGVAIASTTGLSRNSVYDRVHRMGLGAHLHKCKGWAHTCGYVAPPKARYNETISSDRFAALVREGLCASAIRRTIGCTAQAVSRRARGMGLRLHKCPGNRGRQDHTCGWERPT